MIPTGVGNWRNVDCIQELIEPGHVCTASVFESYLLLFRGTTSTLGHRLSKGAARLLHPCTTMKKRGFTDLRLPLTS